MNLSGTITINARNISGIEKIEILHKLWQNRHRGDVDHRRRPKPWVQPHGLKAMVLCTFQNCRSVL